jgi:CRP-like cAMP-binding protein
MPGAVAYRVSDGDHTLLFTGDTGRTDRLWSWLKKRGSVDCLIAEASFPDRMDQLAEISRHLTPRTLAESLRKAGLGPDTLVHVVHLKPSFMEEMQRELAATIEFRLAPLRRREVIRLEKGENGSRILQADLAHRIKDKTPSFDRDDDLYHQRDRLRKDFGLTLPAGETIFRQGEKSRIMYIIQEGKVRIYREAQGMERTLAVLGPGEFFGEMAMFNNRPRSATAVALSDLLLLAFDKTAFEKLVFNNFGIALHIIRTLAHRLQQADTIIENMLYLDPHSKVINTLIQSAYDEGIETREGFLIRTNPEKIADKSGVVINTLRDILADLVNEKIIALRKEALIIPDLYKLKRLLTFLELKDEFH